MVRQSAQEMTGSAVRTVEAGDCAGQWGNDGLMVLSTPAILGHMERLCVATLAEHLDDGELTVGVSVDLNHRTPIPLGAVVTYHVIVPAVHRHIEVRFEVVDAAGVVVADGTHRRAVVRLDDFLSRIGEIGG